MSKNRGSILLPILLVSTIALSIALAAASRSLKGLKTTGETEQSSSAYSAAEAGIEQALYSIETTGSASDITSPVEVGAGGFIKELTVTQSGGGPLYLVEGAVAKDDVAELKLDNYPAGSTLTIFWVNEDEFDQLSDPASLVITYIAGGPPYSVTKAAVNCNTTRNTLNGFSGPSSTHQTRPSVGITFACGYDFNIPAGTTPLVLRIRPMYEESDILVEATAGTDLPPQSLTITATGQAGETERTVEVTRSKPSLPAIFDFVLFSGSASTPLQK